MFSLSPSPVSHTSDTFPNAWCVWLKGQGDPGCKTFFMCPLIERISSTHHVTAGQTWFLIILLHNSDIDLAYGDLDWSQNPSTRNSAGGWQSGSMTDTTQNTGYEPKFCADVSSEHTPITFPSSSSISTERMTWQTPSQPLRILTIFSHLQAAASGTQRSAASTVSAFLNLSSLSSTRKLFRDNEFVPSSFSGAFKLAQSNEIRCRCWKINVKRKQRSR